MVLSPFSSFYRAAPLSLPPSLALVLFIAPSSKARSREVKLDGREKEVL